MKYKVIKSLEQYSSYCDRHEELMAEDEERYIDELELLELLIDDYDRRMGMPDTGGMNPVELVRSLLKDAGLTQAKFASNIGISKQLLSDVLNYRRGISKELVRKLATFFSMSQEAFNRYYALEENRIRQMYPDGYPPNVSMVSEPFVEYKTSKSGDKKSKKDKKK